MDNHPSFLVVDKDQCRIGEQISAQTIPDAHLLHESGGQRVAQFSDEELLLLLNSERTARKVYRTRNAARDDVFLTTSSVSTTGDDGIRNWATSAHGVRGRAMPD